MKNSNENPTTDNQGVKSDSVQTDENVSVEATDNDTNTVESIPYARFNEVTRKNKDLEAKLKDYQTKQEANRVKAMEEQGKFKELNTELTTLGNDQLRKHLSKLQKQQPTNTNTTQPIRDTSGNKVNEWGNLSSEDKRSNWKSILKSYSKNN